MSDKSGKGIFKNRSLSSLLLRHEAFLLLLIVIIVTLVSIFSGGKFFDFNNIRDLILNNTFTGILAMGMLVVLISGGIDLSFISATMVAQYCLSAVIINNPDTTNIFVAFLIPCVIGLFIGVINGVLVYHLKVPSMIITIAMMNALYGLLQWITKSKILYGYPDWFSFQGNALGRALPIGIFVIAVIITWIFLYRLKTGRKIFAYGGNPEAAMRVGVNVLKTQIIVYCFMGLMVGLAAPTQLYILRTYSSSTIVGTELNILAAVVIGGASLAGGKGTLLGTLLGVFLIAIVQNGLVLTGISSYYFKLFTGLVIMISLAFSSFCNRVKQRRSIRTTATELPE